MGESDSTQPLVLGRYQLTERVGTGSSGSVIAAKDSQSGREVVVKFFDGEQDGFPSWTSELRLVMRFKHPHIVPCLDAGYDEVHKLWALVFARAHGGSLRRALVAGTFRKEQRAPLLVSIASALVYAHNQGVIHRDVKPENIVAEREEWLLTDFGAGRFLSRGAVARTMTGSVEYMAPEVKQHGATPRSEQFSLGMVGAELYLGAIPNRQELPQIQRTLEKIDGVARVLARLCAEDPQQRFEDMTQVLIALQEAAKQMDITGSLWERLRPYLIERCGLSESALLQLHNEWSAKGSLLDFLVRKQLLTRPQARSIDAIEKGYMDLPLSVVLGVGPRVSGPREVPTVFALAAIPVSQTEPNQEPAKEPDQASVVAPVQEVIQTSVTAPVQEVSQKSESVSVQTGTLESDAADALEADLEVAPHVALEVAPQRVIAPVQEAMAAPVQEAVQEIVQESAQAPVALSASTVAPPVQSAPTPRRLADVAPGMRIGRYVLQEWLGTGATAKVFRAFHEMLGVPVAVKIFEAMDLSEEPDARTRFLREAQTLVRLEHPNIVRVFDADVQDGLPFIVMEHVGENSLENLIGVVGKLQAPHVARIGLAVAEALEVAARGGLMHRDVKPSNIIERKDGHIKLVDFGIASRRTKDGVLEDPLAALGLVSGTATYIAPEQIESPSTIDFRADMYSLGASLYDAAVGRPPFERESLRELLMAHIHDEPEPITQLVPSFDRHLALVIHRMLRKKPEERYGSWREVKDALSYLLLLHNKTATDKSHPIKTEPDSDSVGSPSVPQSASRSLPPAVDAPGSFVKTAPLGSSASLVAPRTASVGPTGAAVPPVASIPTAPAAPTALAASAARPAKSPAALSTLFEHRLVRMAGPAVAMCLLLLILLLMRSCS